MARLGDNPLKNPLVGNELIPFTDPADNNDKDCTPSIITQFVATNMALASGSTNGLIDGPDLAKLQALPTDAVLASQLGELAQVAIPIFFAAPTNGTIVIYQHVLSLNWNIQTMTLFTSAGSTNLQLQINGTPINFAPFGTTNPATVVSQSNIAGAPRTLHPGDTLGIALSGTTGNCANLVCSVYATAIL